MNIQGIVCFSKYFTINAEMLSKQMNIPVVYNLEPNFAYIVFSAQDACESLLDFQEKNNVKYLIFQSENIESPFFKNPNYIRLLKENKVVQYSRYTTEKCKELGIESHGFFNWLYPAQHIKGKRTIDLLFFGAMNQKRYDILHAIQNKFPKKNIVATCDAFGKDLDELLRKTKTVINISYYDNAVLETHRINQCISYGCNVISNRSVDKDLNEEYAKLVTFCGNTIGDYLSAVSKII